MNINKHLDNIELHYSDPDKMMKRIERELERIKHESFGKVKFRENKVSNTNLNKLQERKRICKNTEEIAKIKDEIATELESLRKTNMKKYLAKFKEIKSKKGNIAAIFKLKETIVGSKKVMQEKGIK